MPLFTSKMFSETDTILTRIRKEINIKSFRLTAVENPKYKI